MDFLKLFVMVRHVPLMLKSFALTVTSNYLMGVVESSCARERGVRC